MIVEKSDFYALLRSRHSIRRFTDRTVPVELVQRLIEAACQAPSAHNRQPWRFAVLSGESEKQALAGEMGQALCAARRADGDAAEAIDADAARSYQRITSAAVVVVVCLTMEAMDVYPDEARTNAEHMMAVQSAAMAGMNILLAAHAEGLGACWLCAPLFAPDAARRSLDLPKTWEPQGLILLGYAAEQGRSRERMPLEAVSLWR
jgi:coenzyme F420-0:L-glutamate ligase/coenzyme F420-1:gamma-L-glutamate ligase